MPKDQEELCNKHFPDRVRGHSEPRPTTWIGFVDRDAQLAAFSVLVYFAASLLLLRDAEHLHVCVGNFL